MGLGMGLKGYVFGFLNELERRVTKVVTVFERAAVLTTAGVIDAFKLLTIGLIGAASALVKQFVATTFDIIRTSVEVALGELEDLTPKSPTDGGQGES